MRAWPKRTAVPKLRRPRLAVRGAGLIGMARSLPVCQPTQIGPMQEHAWIKLGSRGGNDGVNEQRRVRLDASREAGGLHARRGTVFLWSRRAGQLPGAGRL